jgi:hypothetical protein
MKARQVWTLQSLLSCVLWNGILIAVLYFLAHGVTRGLDAWVVPWTQPDVQNIPEDLRGSLSNLKRLLDEAGAYLLPVLAGTGAFATLVLWLFILIQGRSMIRRAESEFSPKVEARAPKARREGGEGRQLTDQPTPAAPPEPSVQPALQVLAALQQEGRFIDFLQEDLNFYDDAQIGAAVRSIHEGCKRALGEIVELKPVLEESEGSTVTVPPGFDPRAVRLTGNVAGDPPFKGLLRHRGWKAARIELPKPVATQEKNRVIAPAEVEIEE